MATNRPPGAEIFVKIFVCLIDCAFKHMYEAIFHGIGKAPKKKIFFSGKSPKLWVGGGQES